MNKTDTIYVAGHTGLVGSAIARELIAQGFHVATVDRHTVDLTSKAGVSAYFHAIEPDYVFLAAARVAGIAGNIAKPVAMLATNLKIELNVLEAAHDFGVKKLLFLGSSCIYPRLCPQPIKEEYLLTGPLELSNEGYALAKIAGIKLCQAYHQQFKDNFISVMPTNLYGPHDRYAEGGHVIPDMIRKFHAAKLNKHPTVLVWGNGTVRREFLYVDDLARACILAMQQYDQPEPINIGYGSDITIRELAGLIADIVGLPQDRILFDPSGPSGTPVKLLDSSKIRALGWEPKVGLATGLELAYADYLSRTSK
jgi:GDP-L-fucose synthase